MTTNPTQETVTLHIEDATVMNDERGVHSGAVVAFCHTPGDHYGVHYIDHYDGTWDDFVRVVGFIRDRIEGSGYPYIVLADEAAR